MRNDDEENRTPTGRVPRSRPEFGAPYGSEKKFEDRHSEVVFNTDLSELEKRIEAQFSASSTKLLDPHKITAAIINGVMYSEVTPEQRRRAKSLNFSQMYSPEGYHLPERARLIAIYTKEEIVQIQIDTKWPGTLDIHDHIKNFFKPKV